MANVDYTYAVARIRSKELKLLTNKDLNAMLELPDYSACLNFLQEKGWGNGENLQGEEILKCERQKIWDLMQELVKEEDAFDVFLIPNDFHNLKVSVKAVIRDVNADSMFLHNCKTPYDKIYNAVKEQKYFMLPDYLQNTAKEAVNLLLQTSDGQLCDVLIDKASLEAVAKIGQESKNEIIKLYSEIFVASANIKIAVRCAKTQKNLEFIKRAIAPCDSLNEHSLAVAASKGVDEICSVLSTTSYKDAVEFLKDSPSAFEKYCDDLITNKMQTQKWEPFTIGPLVAYIIARENEIKAVKLILSCKLNSLDESIIKERLRKMYV